MVLFDDWATRPTRLKDLSMSLPQGPLTLATSLADTATIVRSAAQLIGDWLTGGGPAVPLAIVMRTVLMGSGRILLCLAPTDEDTLKRNAGLVLWSECKSLLTALRVSAKFESLGSLAAPQDLITQVEAQVLELRSQLAPIRLLGEAKMLEAMGTMVAQVLSSDLDVESAQSHHEHVAWMFNRYSGIARGFGWPMITPPAFLWADLGVVGGTAALRSNI